MHPLFDISDRGLKQNARRASFLNLLARGIEFFFQFITLTVLARLLTPADFGVFAMATAFVWIIMNFGDLGLAAAILQQRDLNERQASAVFQVNLWAGLAFGAIFLLSSPLLGSFYGDHRVTQVAAALSLTFVFSGLTAVQRALLRRALLFDALLRAQIAASLVSSIVAVLLALNGAGYWALTGRALADPLVYTIAVWISAGWLPVRAQWDDTTKGVLKYGRYYLGSSLVSALAAQADKVLIGWRYGSAELGTYALAYRLFLAPVQQVSWPLGHVMIPALSRLRDDPDRLKRWYLKLVRLVTFVSFPPLFSLAICADDAVYVIAGPQWGDAADILRLLAPVAALYVASSPSDWLMRAQGHADRSFRWAVISTIICLISFGLGLSWGAVGVAAGLALTNLLLIVPCFLYSAKGTSIRLKDVFKAMLPSLVTTALTLGLVWAFRVLIAQDWHPLNRFMVTGAIIAIVMTIGAAFLYRRLVLRDRLLNSDRGPIICSLDLTRPGTESFTSRTIKGGTRDVPESVRWFLRVRVRMASITKRLRQLLSHDTRDLLWLGYMLCIAPWAHRAAIPLQKLHRLQVRHRLQTQVDRRLELLRGRVARRCLPQDGYRVALVQLCPELEQICRSVRRSNEEIPLASIDQDGFFCPRFQYFWAAPRVHADSFLPRSRFELTIVDRDGWVGVLKNFRGDKVAFVNELEASLDLEAARCHVPPVLGVDFERLSITFAYINGEVVRESLAQVGAPLRDRDVPPGLTKLGSRKIEQERRINGRRLVAKVLEPETIERIGEAMLEIHRASYTLEDVKYGNVIIEASTKTPYFIDCERALSLRNFSRTGATYLRDCDAEKLNQLFGTSVLTAKLVRQFSSAVGYTLYSPFYAGAGIWFGPIWNPELGILRWRHTLAKHVPVPCGGRVLDLGANDGFNALQMLRGGANEVVGLEIDGAAIKRGLFMKRIFEWADNVKYNFSYVHASHADIGSLNLGRFDLITAFCTLYYLSPEAMTATISALAKLSDTLVLQCNNDCSIERNDPQTFMKASLAFNLELVRNNGFPNVRVIEPRGSERPLVIARTRAAGSAHVPER